MSLAPSAAVQEEERIGGELSKLMMQHYTLLSQVCPVDGCNCVLCQHPTRRTEAVCVRCDAWRAFDEDTGEVGALLNQQQPKSKQQQQQQQHKSAHEASSTLAAALEGNIRNCDKLVRLPRASGVENHHQQQQPQQPTDDADGEEGDIDVSFLVQDIEAALVVKMQQGLGLLQSLDVRQASAVAECAVMLTKLTEALKMVTGNE
jgi:hypothetical protein